MQKSRTNEYNLPQDVESKRNPMLCPLPVYHSFRTWMTYAEWYYKNAVFSFIE